MWPVIFLILAATDLAVTVAVYWTGGALSPNGAVASSVAYLCLAVLYWQECNK
jgi:type II secretory pathway component PulM